MPGPCTLSVVFPLSGRRGVLVGHSLLPGVSGLTMRLKARRSRRANGGALTEDITKQYQTSSVEYLKAATNHPKDDEGNACESCGQCDSEGLIT